MPLLPNYVEAMELLGQVCLAYRQTCGGDRAWLVGGASVVILTDGAFHSGDFDLVASNEAVFREILLKHGFQDEKGQGRAESMLHVGWMHPDHPDLGWQLVTGPLFDGRSDKSRGIAIELKPDSELTLPAWEDLIADRLSQFSAQDGKSHHELVEQARLLFQLASEIDHDYLKRRVTEDGGDLSLLFG
jgi:hypothetical protein